jgi:hypothetical protein
MYALVGLLVVYWWFIGGLLVVCWWFVGSILYISDETQL